MSKSNSLNFNQKLLAALAPDEESLASLGLTADKNGKVDLFDAQMPGLALRMMATGLKTYYFTYRMGGRGHNYKWHKIGRFVDMPLKVARERVRACRADVDRGIDPAETKRIAATKGITVADVADRFMREYATPINLKPKTISDYAKAIDLHILPALGKRRVKDLNFETLSAWHRGIPSKDGSGKVAANRALRTLSSICTQAEGWECIPVGGNPCKLVRMFPEIARQRDIQLEELEAIGIVLDKLNPIETPEKKRDDGGKFSGSAGESNLVNIWILEAIKVIALCFGRINEVLHLRRDRDVFLDKGFAVIREHKTSGIVGNKLMELPIAAVDILRALPEMRSNPWYFPRADSIEEPICDSAVRKVWNKICEMAGVEDLHLQDFRSFAASEGHEKGIDVLTASKILGHKDTRTMQKHYTKPRMSKVKEAAEIVSAPVAIAFMLKKAESK